MSKKTGKSERTEQEADDLVRKNARKLGLLPRKTSDSGAKETLFDDFSLAADAALLKGASPRENALDTRTATTTKSAKKAGNKGQKEPGSARPHYHGHRERLKKRLLESDGEALADYELLEAVLFRALPRRDTKPIAKELLQRFGSFAEVINAPEGELRKIDYIKDAAITEFSLVRAAARRFLKGQTSQKPVLASWARVLDHCRAAMAFEAREQFRILFLDKRNRLILDEVQQTGTIDHTPVYVREICRRALEVNATAIILAHNHPSGDPTPSRGDIEMTREIVKVARGLGICVHDHIIIARDGHASFKGLGLI